MSITDTNTTVYEVAYRDYIAAALVEARASLDACNKLRASDAWFQFTNIDESGQIRQFLVSEPRERRKAAYQASRAALAIASDNARAAHTTLLAATKLDKKIIIGIND